MVHLVKKPHVVALAFMALAAPASAEARWDGLLNNSGQVNWFELNSTTPKDNSLEARGIETDFSEDPMFKREFQIETLRDQVQKPFAGFTIER